MTGLYNGVAGLSGSTGLYGGQSGLWSGATGLQEGSGGPALSLNFLSGALDSRITFTRSSTATFVGSNGFIQTAAINTPRFDYDPVTLAPKGLLIEEQRTNLFLQSQTFGTASWTKALLTVSSDAANGPDNLLTADKLIPNSGATFGTAYVFQQITKAASAIAYTASVFAKPDGYGYVLLRCQDSGGSANRATVTVNVATGAIVSAAATAGTFSNASAKVTPYGNGFFRVELTFTSSADTVLRLLVFPTDSGGTVGDGVKGVLLWGAQLEAAAFASSYIPTVASQVTRSADSAAMTGTNFSSWYNQTEGTFVVDGITSSRTTAAATAEHALEASTTLRMVRGASSVALGWNIGSTTFNSFGVTTTNLQFKSAAAYKATSNAASLNASAPLTDAGSTYGSPTSLGIGCATGGSQQFNGHIRSVAYYNRRLTNAQLQALSTP